MGKRTGWVVVGVVVVVVGTGFVLGVRTVWAQGDGEKAPQPSAVESTPGPSEPVRLSAPAAAEDAVSLPAAGPVETAEGESDPEKHANAYIARTKQEAAAAVKRLKGEAASLRERLKRVETAIARWDALLSALDPEGQRERGMLESGFRPAGRGRAMLKDVQGGAGEVELPAPGERRVSARGVVDELPRKIEDEPRAK